MSERHKATMRRFIHEAWALRNHSVCDELLTADYKHFMPGSSEPTIGPEPYKQLIDTFLAAFPDGRLNADEVIVEGDRICVLWTFTGTHQGPFNGIQPTGSRVKLQGVGVGRMRNEQISEVQSIFDTATLIRQLQPQ